jgi:endonuclease V-like protein UPF0215 family
LTRKLTVKKEIRILGLDLCYPRRFVGAVVRGSLYLDGLLVFPPESRTKTSSVASRIRGTRFFPELRAVMTHDPTEELDPEVIERLIKLPVIQVDSARKKNSDGFKPYKVGRKWLHVKSSLPPGVVQEILSTTWAKGMLPEPLRIAHLVARSRFFGKTRVSKLTNKFAAKA